MFMNRVLMTLLVFTMSVFLANFSNADYALEAGAFTTSGGQGDSANYGLFSSFGQAEPLETPVGSARSADFKYWAGFLLAIAPADTTLPVELSSFTATLIPDGVQLRWRTETEVNNIGFGVYRSDAKDGNYTKIAFVSGAGNSGMPIEYHLADKKVEPGKIYFYYLEDIDIAGQRSKSDIIEVVIPPVPPVPKEFRLLQNYPNPFNPDTWLPYELASDSTVVISIYNIKGQFVRQLHLGEQKAGYYITKDKAAYWDGRNYCGEKIASGIYLCRLQAGDFNALKRMVILK